MAKQIGTESQTINDQIMDLETSIAFIECELEIVRTEYQFHLIGSAEQLAILKALGLDSYPARLINLKQQVIDLAEA